MIGMNSINKCGYAPYKKSPKHTESPMSDWAKCVASSRFPSLPEVIGRVCGMVDL